MPSAATIRLQIEAALAHKVPSALTPATRTIRPVAPTGVSEVDGLLEGGLPVGAITEMVGPESSGRTAIALSCLSQLTQAGRVCAWIDVSETLSLRIGLSYTRSMTKQSAEKLVMSRRHNGPFGSAEDLAKRIPSLNRKELTRLAQIGAPNHLDDIEHRRDALWQVERAGKLEGPLFQDGESLREDSDARPLQQMNVEERLVADYAGTGLTVGKHPMHYRRPELKRSNILSAEELRTSRDGEFVRVAGCIIARQRPGMAKGFIFISMEDETGIANVIVTPDLYDRNRLLVTRSKFLLVEGPLQKQDNVIHIKATRLTPLSDRALEVRSHDFH